MTAVGAAGRGVEPPSLFSWSTVRRRWPITWPTGTTRRRGSAFATLPMISVRARACGRVPFCEIWAGCGLEDTTSDQPQHPPFPFSFHPLVSQPRPLSGFAITTSSTLITSLTTCWYVF